jgi:DNA-binding MarR family transcriptional regulator
MNPQELELDILEHIHAAPGTVRQRDLAHIIGKSLGMTNSILQRLAEKGLLVVSRVNNRNITYAVTPHGIRAIAGRSFRYFKRTIKNVVFYKDAVEHEVQQFLLAHPSVPRRFLVLQGASDIDFILEHMAVKYSLSWHRCVDHQAFRASFSSIMEPTLLFIGEDGTADEAQPPFSDILSCLSLRSLIESSHAMPISKVNG